MSLNVVSGPSLFQFWAYMSHISRFICVISNYHTANMIPGGIIRYCVEKRANRGHISANSGHEAKMRDRVV